MFPAGHVLTIQRVWAAASEQQSGRGQEVRPQRDLGREQGLGGAETVDGGSWRSSWPVETAPCLWP